MIAFKCPGCFRSFSVKDHFAGKRTKCPKCAFPLTVPAGPAVAEPTLPHDPLMDAPPLPPPPEHFCVPRPKQTGPIVAFCAGGTLLILAVILLVLGLGSGESGTKGGQGDRKDGQGDRLLPATEPSRPVADADNYDAYDLIKLVQGDPGIATRLKGRTLTIRGIFQEKLRLGGSDPQGELTGEVFDAAIVILADKGERPGLCGAFIGRNADTLSSLRPGDSIQFKGKFMGVDQLKITGRERYSSIVFSECVQR
ncbi:MAG: hypothetical protein U0793_07925 [Gemmataceae bacterium]